MSGAPILFLVVGKPTEDVEKQLILGRLSQELKTWNEHLSGCKLDAELEKLTQENTEVTGGHKELVLMSDKLSLVVLYNPTLAGLKLFSKQYLAIKSCYRQLIYSGPAVGECGSWMLQDGLLQFGDLARILKDLEMPDFEPFYVNAFNVGKWTQENIEKSTSLCIKLNPEVQAGSADARCRKLFEILDGFFEENILDPVEFSEKDKFTVSCFRAPNQNSSVVRIGDFKMLINADSTRFPPQFYNGFDLMLLTTSDLRSLKWLQSSLDAKEKSLLGMLYSNALSSISHKVTDSNESPERSLLINISDILKSLSKGLNDANIPIQSCLSSSHLQPTTIYHKAGFGTLQLYALSPSADSKEVKELQKSQSNENIICNFPPTSCVLLWQPFNKKLPPIRLFFSGLASQQSLFEGLVKLKNIQSFSTWEGLSLEESMNKLNKLKSKGAPEKSGLVNGNALKTREPAKTTIKQKATDSSSATSHSGHGDATFSTAKTQTRSRPSKSEADKIEKSKPNNSSVLSTPGKSEVQKQPLTKTRYSMGLVPQKTSTRTTSKDIPTSTKPVSAATSKVPAYSGKEAAKQVQLSKSLAPKPAKETKPAVKTAPMNRVKPPKPSLAQQRKDTHVPEKTKIEASPKLEKKGKPQKTDEKKDVEKSEKLEAKIDTKLIETTTIESNFSKKEVLVDLVSPLKNECVNEAIPDADKLDEQFSDQKSELSALTSPVEEKLDQMVSSREGEFPEEVPVKEIEERDADKPGSESEHVDAGSDAQSATCSEDNLVEVEQPEEAGASLDDLDEDSLGSKTDKNHNGAETEEAVGAEGEGLEEDCNVLEPTKHIVDEMARSGISLAESGGTESAPNENLYSQDLGEESPLEEEEKEAEVHQMEKTLLFSEALEPAEIKGESKCDESSHSEHESVEAEPVDVEECIEKDVMEECIEKDVIEELEKQIEPKEALLTKEKGEDFTEEIDDDDIEGAETLTEEECLLAKSDPVDEEVPALKCDASEEQHKEEVMSVRVEKENAIFSEYVGAVPSSDDIEVTGLSGKTNAFEEVAHKRELKESGLEPMSAEGSALREELPIHKEADGGGDGIQLSCDTEASKPHDTYAMDQGRDTEVCDADREKIKPEICGSVENVAHGLESVDVEGSGLAEENEDGHGRKETIEINFDYFGQKVEENKDFVQGLEDQMKCFEEEKRTLREDQVFEEKDDNQLIDFGSSKDLAGVSLLKKDSGMDDLASICGGNLSSSSNNFFSESSDSVKAVAGSVSEARLSISDDDKCSKGDFNQCCDEIANHLNIIKEHRDAVQKELLSSTEKDVVFYNKNVGFQKEHVDELSEEDQDELETISEHPEIEEDEEEELLMNKNVVHDQHAPPLETETLEGEATGSKQLIDFGECLSKGALHPFTDSFQRGNTEEVLKADPFLKIGGDLSPEDAPAIHSSSMVDELVAAWGEPMKLPSPEKPKKLNLKKEGGVQESNPPAATVVVDQSTAAKKRVSSGIGKQPQATNETSSKNIKTTFKAKSVNDAKKPESSQKTVPFSHPFYTDVAFVYERDDKRHSTYNSNFFWKVRSHYYVLSSACPAVLDHLVEAKQTWDNLEVPTVAIVNRLEFSKVEPWISSKKALLDKLKIAVVPQIDQNILDSDLRLNVI